MTTKVTDWVRHPYIGAPYEAYRIFLKVEDGKWRQRHEWKRFGVDETQLDEWIPTYATCFPDHYKDYIDPAIEGYQVIINGTRKNLHELTKEELQLELVKAIDFMEDMDEKIEAISHVVNDWRSGGLYR